MVVNGTSYETTDVANDGDNATNDATTEHAVDQTVKTITFDPENNLMTLSSDATTVIETIDEDEIDGAVEYYNLQGQRVEEPTTGVYIRLRAGQPADKVLIR